MYREHPTPPSLTPLVECIWTSRGRIPAHAATTSRILPDGCMDIIFDLGDPPRPTGGAAHGLPAYVVGAMRTAAVFRLSGQVDLIGVRLRPGAAPAFLRMPAAEATDAVVPLEALWGRGAGELAGALADAAGRDRKVAVLAAALGRRASASGGRDEVVAGAHAAITASGGRAPLEALERLTGVAARTLQRRFAAAVGLTPGEASRVARFRRALRLLDDEPRLPLARVALLAGYADQPHLTRAFRALAGVTPATWRSWRGRPVASVQDGGDGPE